VAGHLQHELLVLAVAPEADYVEVDVVVDEDARVEGLHALDDLGVGRNLLLRVQLVLVDHAAVGDLGLALDDAEQVLRLHLLERVI